MDSIRYNPQVDDFFARGCGRCALFETPQCRVHKWQEEMQMLRDILLDAGLTEERKWGNPCYTINGKNVVMMGALKEFCSIGFFKGSLLSDPKQLLIAAGENTQAARQLRFTETKSITQLQKQITTFVQEAIALEEAGRKVAFKAANEFSIPDELLEYFRDSSAFEKAFYALTPGRQRGYLIHFAEPKQSKTRQARIEKYHDQIMRGEGLHDAYRKSSK
jgi:uncharacterized protein YdeI (YjbR/CyaY-like superfamily)